VNNNPYAAPNSDVSGALGAMIPLYSPLQAAAGAFLGGPVGLIYFIHANFAALGNEEHKKKTLIYGGMLLVALLVILPLLPEWFPSLPFTIAYVIAARYVVDNYQVSKQGIIDSPQYDFHSNWRVVGFSLLCMVGSMLAIFAPLFLLAEAGLLD